MKIGRAGREADMYVLHYVGTEGTRTINELYMFRVLYILQYIGLKSKSLACSNL